MAREPAYPVIFAVNGLGRAYTGACSELGLGMNGQDVSRRERLANILVRLFQAGEHDAEALQRRAMIYLQNSQPHAGR
jgi:hypothetical protein